MGRKHWVPQVRVAVHDHLAARIAAGSISADAALGLKP
jgi:hypothetical protein